MSHDSFIRKSIVPDIQVRLLTICLSDNENGIFTTQRGEDILCDNNFVFKEIISNRINSQHIPLTQRKKLLYEISKNKKDNFYEALEDYNILPITMRKHMLIKSPRAG